MNTIAITDKEFSQFQRFIHEAAGINLSPAKKVLVSGRLARRLQHWRVGSYGEYFQLLSGGQATHQITRDVLAETRLTQVFLTFDLPTIDTAGNRAPVIDGILASLRTPAPAVRYPGERVLKAREESRAQGIAVDPRIWNLVQEL